MSVIYRVPHTIEFTRLSLYKNDGDKHSDRPAVFTWAIRGDNPRITVYTNHFEYGTRDNREGIINAPMDHHTLWLLLNSARDIIKGEETNIQIKCYGSIFEDGERKEGKRLVSTIVLNRNDLGIISIGLKEDGKPFLEFPLCISEFHKILGTDNKPYDTAKLSNRYALRYFKNVSNVMDEVWRDIVRFKTKEYGDPKELPIKEDNTNKIVEKEETIFDDDIPF